MSKTYLEDSEKERVIRFEGKKYRVKYVLYQECEADGSYGADADGNRGETAYFVEREWVEDFDAWEITGEDEDIETPVNDEVLLNRMQKYLGY